MRTFLIIALCAALTGGGTVGASWVAGPHKSLQNELETMLSDDLGLTDVSRNFSPYCALGSCPKVSAQSLVKLEPSGAVARIRQELLRREYVAGDGDPIWKEYTRKGVILKYRVEPSDGEVSRVFWEIGRD